MLNNEQRKKIQDKINKFEEMVDTHDCRLDRDSGCFCITWNVQIGRLQRKLKED